MFYDIWQGFAVSVSSPRKKGEEQGKGGGAKHEDVHFNVSWPLLCKSNPPGGMDCSLSLVLMTEDLPNIWKFDSLVGKVGVSGLLKIDVGT